MADFRIKLDTTLDSSKCKSEFETLKKQLEGEGINLKVDTKFLKNQMNDFKKVINNAFKIDAKNMSNLKEIKETMQEINKLSKQAQKSIFGSSGDSGQKNQVATVKNLVQEYDKLQAKQKSIEQQMSKTSNKQSYATLSKELVKVRQEAESVGKALDKMGAVKGNSDITKSLANTFQSVQKQIDTTQTKIDKLFKNKNLGGSQGVELAKLKKELTSLQNISLDKIVNADKPYAEMSKLIRGSEELKTAFSKIDINIKFNDQIDKASNSINGLIVKVQQLGKSGFVDKGGINNLVSTLEKLNSVKIDPNTANAKAQLKELENSISQCVKEYNRLNAESKSNKSQFKFDTNFNKTLSDLQVLKQRCNELGQSTSDVNRLENSLRELGNVETDKAAAGLQRIKTEMSSMKQGLNGVDTSVKGSKKLFNDFYTSIAAYSIGDMLADGIVSGVRNVKNTIVDLDSAFRDLSKVAPDSFRSSKEEFDSLRDSAIQAGQEVAKSSVDIINSTTSALQAGFKSVDEAMKYAKQSAMFSNVADMNQADTDQALKAILSTYGGVENALKGTNSQIQNATKSYSMLNRVMDASKNFQMEVAPYVQKCA